MAIGRYFRGLSAYDLLGYLLPGVVGLLTILGFTADPPVSTEIASVLLFGVLAFILGSVIQSYASKAVGKPQSFIRTIESAERVPELQYTPEDETDTDPPEHSGCICSMFKKLRWIFYAIIGPLICWRWPPEWGEKLDDAILVNRIWQHIVDTHEIPFETDKYGVLYHLMSSKIDGAQSSSRAIRIQAIRNFNRGMWIATWFLLVIVSLVLLIDSQFETGDTIGIPLVSDIVYAQPSFFNYWTPLWSLWLIALIATFVFWSLFKSFEEDYIEYLFTDYAVAIAESGTEISFAQDPIYITGRNTLEGIEWTLTTELGNSDQEKTAGATQRGSDERYKN